MRGRTKTGDDLCGEIITHALPAHRSAVSRAPTVVFEEVVVMRKLVELESTEAHQLESK